MKYKTRNLLMSLKKIKNIYKYIILGVIVLAVALFLLLIFNKDQNVGVGSPSRLVFNIKGPREVTYYVKDKYEEYGYEAYYDDENITGEVEVSNNINMDIKGSYEVIYKIKKNNEEKVISRTVIVDEKDKTRNLSLELKGDITINIEQYSKYVDPGYIALDNVEGNITNKVKVEGEIDTNNIGEFFITYQITNNKGQTIKKIRVINIIAANYSLNINGDSRINISKNSQFVDPGYYAYDAIDGDLTKKVRVSGNVNTKIAGLYVINYKVTNGRNVTKEKIRVVKVEEDDINNIGNLTFGLLGGDKVTLDLNKTYVEPGYYALDSIDGNIKNKVDVSGFINNKVSGIYSLVYKITNSTGVSKTLIREVEVIDKDSIVIIDNYNKNITNNNYVITASIIDDNDLLSYSDNKIEQLANKKKKKFKKMILPNLTETTNSKAAYTVENNGQYAFKIYDEDDELIETKVMVVNNIDKEGPTGTCTVNLDGYVAKIFVKATDNLSSIAGYKYNTNGTYGTYINSSELETTIKDYKEVKVMVKDTYANETEIICTNETIVYPPIKPMLKFGFDEDNSVSLSKDPNDVKYCIEYMDEYSKCDIADDSCEVKGEKCLVYSNEEENEYEGNMNFSEKTDSLIVQNVKTTNFLLTYIWAKNPYEQIHNFTAADVPMSSSSLDNLFQKAFKRRNLKNKLAIAFNGECSVEYNGANTKRTPYGHSNIPYILGEGNLLREDTKKLKIIKFPQDNNTYMWGINKNNQLEIYLDTYKDDKSIQNRQLLFDSIVKSGTKNTFMTHGYLVKDGIAMNHKLSSQNPSKQFWDRNTTVNAVCQVDDNNFIRYSAIKSVSHKSLAKRLVKLGCKTAVFVDGGGSTNVYSKTTTATEWNKNIEKERKGMYSIYYFTELD